MKGEGLEHSWYAVSPAATIVKPASPAASASGSSASTSTGTTGDMYGSGY
jgi:hypothetical protein